MFHYIVHEKIRHCQNGRAVFPKNGIFVATEGPSKAVADGFYILTKPLSKGNHAIQVKSSLICPAVDCLERYFATKGKYNLIVK